jgi:CheY-like chemotaxis protein
MATVPGDGDEKGIRKCPGQATRSEGSAGGSASNGLREPELVRRKRPDLVTLDLNIPEMNGLAVLR